MTTFQVLVDALVRALTHLLPLSPLVPQTLLEKQLEWNLPTAEMELLVLFTGSVTFLVFFRYDWMGMFSALLGSLARPMSLRPDRRSLDQHTLLFLLIVFVPWLSIRALFSPLIGPENALIHPGVCGVLSIVTAVFFRLSSRWNKRIFGLNHLRLGHAALLSFLLVFSHHPAIPLMGALWIGFAFCNYHFEAIFKYSMLIAGLALFSTTVLQLQQVHLRDAFEQIGHLNSIAAMVVCVTVFWIGLENLQKTIQEGTFQSFLWVNAMAGLYFFIYFFTSVS